MPANINLKLLKLKFESFGIPDEIKASVLEEARLLKEVAWLTPKLVIKAQDIKRMSFETLRNFKIQDTKTKKFTYSPASFLLGTLENWFGVERMPRSSTWVAKRDEVAAEIIKIVHPMGREDAMAAIDETVADTVKETVKGAVDDAVDAAAKTNVSMGGDAVDVRRVSEMAAKDAVFTTLGYLNWILVKDAVKGTPFEENPFEPMMGLWKLGLWPIGIARYAKIHFWIGVPPSAQGVLPVIK